MIRFPFQVHEDETVESKYQWCPECGYNALIITYSSRIGKMWRCQCGLRGRFGDGTSQPSLCQPGFEHEELTEEFTTELDPETSAVCNKDKL